MTGDLNVVLFASTRADLYPLSPLLHALRREPRVVVTLLASGTMRNPRFGDPMAGIDLTGVRVLWAAGDLGASDTPRDLAVGGARISEAVALALDEAHPHVCVVLGDRWELLYAVPPMLLSGNAIVHLHGGEVTEGAIDDRIRHAISKLADLHCVSTEGAARRLYQMGEPEDRVFVTGAPSIDRFKSVKPASEADLVRIFGMPPARPLGLVTYHPVTAGTTPPKVGAAAVFEAVASTLGSAIITHPGLDNGQGDVIEAVNRAVATHAHLRDVPALGSDYLSVLAACDVVVGNSSSGIIEAATFGVSVVNVGDRQQGRDSGGNVVDVEEDQSAIEAAIRQCLQPDFREHARRSGNAYGDGHAVPRIVEVIRLAGRRDLKRKGFVNHPKEPVP